MSLWVVEMLVGDWWGPTVGVGLTRSCAREVVKDWRRRNPDDKFRVRPYVRDAEASRR